MCKLTPKRLRFCELYIGECHFNGTQAYINAGYKATGRKSASVCATQLLREPEIQEQLARLQADLREQTEITKQMIVGEHAKMGFANMLDYVTVQDDGYAYVDLSALTRDQAAAIQECTVEEYMDGRGDDARLVKRVKIKLSDKRANLESISKMLGFNAPEVKEHTGPNGGPIETYTLTAEERKARIDELNRKRGD